MQVSLRYGDGSLATVTYLTNAHRKFPKETFEASSGGRTARLDNFRRATVWSVRGSRQSAPRISGQRAAREIKAFMDAVRTGGPMPISLESLTATTRATLSATSASRARRYNRCESDPGGRGAVCSMNSVDLEWRLQRLSKMSHLRSEMARLRTRTSQTVGVQAGRTRSPTSDVVAPRRARRGSLELDPGSSVSTFPSGEMRQAVPSEVRRRVIDAADEILAGRWEVLGTVASTWRTRTGSSIRSPEDEHLRSTTASRSTIAPRTSLET